jgi:hypothetical protein
MTINIKKCTYCFNNEHTVKDCVERKQKLGELERINSESRKQTLELLMENNVCAGSLIEMCNFTTAIGEPSSTLYYVKSIRWHFMVDLCIESFMDYSMENYLIKKKAKTTNYANLTIHNATDPDIRMTLTNHSLFEMKKYKSLLERPNIKWGDFFVHDGGDWKETLKTVPQHFLAGKFYNDKLKVIT